MPLSLYAVISAHDSRTNDITIMARANSQVQHHPADGSSTEASSLIHSLSLSLLKDVHEEQQLDIHAFFDIHRASVEHAMRSSWHAR